MNTRNTKQPDGSLTELITLLASVPGLKIEGFLDRDAHFIDVLGLWRDAIQYGAVPSSSISLQESRPLIDHWFNQRIAFLGISPAVSAMLVSVPKYAVVPFTKVTIVPESDWIVPLCSTLRQSGQELDLILANGEQDRLLVFLETEHDLLAFERTPEPEEV